ncbi:hypothetical protein [Bacteroides eggerthii]|uniref:hypothetical protein n=1 Tax=Bacteroides eggerthii TaxID=28111 RepID=UPI001EF7C414|nr:hypothetical protein [Bacteroides eggerthii]MCG4759837.1 hypothetical protein [Bacteroides eggerthii]
MKRNILSTIFTLCCLLPITAQSLSKTDSLQIEIAQLENALAKLLQKSEMRKDIVIELSYKGFG